MTLLICPPSPRIPLIWDSFPPPEISSVSSLGGSRKSTLEFDVVGQLKYFAHVTVLLVLTRAPRLPRCRLAALCRPGGPRPASPALDAAFTQRRPWRPRRSLSWAPVLRSRTVSSKRTWSLSSICVRVKNISFRATNFAYEKSPSPMINLRRQ
jgi:hypothetical protein